MIALVAALLAATIWIYLAIARGGFWRGLQDDRAMNDAFDPGATEPSHAWPRVVAVIPARDEAELVGSTVGSLLAQRYPGTLSVIVVDDHSDDGTAAVARDAALAANAAERLTVVPSPPLPAGWTGKLWAVSNGIAAAERSPDPPEYFLLTDADIRYEPGAAAALVSSAVADRLVLSSLMVHLRCESRAERWLIPAFVFFFQMLYPFAWVGRPDRRTAAAAGGCVLVRRDALNAAGGIAAIRDALIDDCALARRLKSQGPIRLALGEQVRSMRAYPAFDDIRRMVVRSAYAQLGFSWWRLILVVGAMLLVFVMPVLLAIGGHGWTQVVGFGTWALMASLFVPTLRRYRVPAWSAMGLPVIATTYLAFTIESALQHWQGRGGMWKGRVNGAGAAGASGSGVEADAGNGPSVKIH